MGGGRDLCTSRRGDMGEKCMRGRVSSVARLTIDSTGAKMGGKPQLL